MPVFTRRVAPLLLLILTACGGGEVLPETAPVSGVLTYKGKPVEGATIVFMPVNAKRTNPGYSTSDKEGKYKVTTYTADDGALLGEHEITVQLFDNVNGQSSLPGKYGYAKKSGLTATIKAGMNDVPLKLE